MRCPVLAIDPGPSRSAWVFFRDGQIVSKDISPNRELLFLLSSWSDGAHLAVEMVQSFGMPVGAEVFETVFWIGRFCQAWSMNTETQYGGAFKRIPRIAIKNHLCHSSKAKDSNIRQALIDRFGPPGTKKNPGLTYGISKDLWSALAVAVTFADSYE